MGLAVLARRRASSFPGPLPSIPQEVARAIEPPAAHKILQTLAAGVVCGFLAVVMSLSLGNLLFFGVMHDSVPIALGMALFTTTVVAAIGALTSPIRGVVSI